MDNIGLTKRILPAAFDLALSSVILSAVKRVGNFGMVFHSLMFTMKKYKQRIFHHNYFAG